MRPYRILTSDTVSYGLASLSVMGEAGAVYLHFGLWAVAIIPAWFVVREFGVTLTTIKLKEDAEEKGRE